MRSTHTINNIYKRISFELIDDIGVIFSGSVTHKLFADNIKLYVTIDCAILSYHRQTISSSETFYEADPLSR